MKPDERRDPDATLSESGETLSSGAHAPQVEVHDVNLDASGAVARYEVGGELGAGGMGEVRLCRDNRMGRAVAMKILRRFKDQPQVRARFLREAQIQAQLEHPAVVPVYDMGRNQDGVEFFTMKRVRGHTLAQILDHLRAGDAYTLRTFSQRRLLAAFSTVCLALDYAHQRGVLHRDLKPANVMLGDFGEVYLLDWGVATVRADAVPEGAGDAVSTSVEGQIQTQAGAISGTPGYIAPEVLRGKKADARSEVYSMAALLFEILSLERLHEGPIAQRIGSTLAGTDARFSVRAPGRDVAPELEALCVRAAADAPEDRLPSVRELSDALERHLDGDRDLALRRGLAREHATSAARSADKAFSGQIEAIAIDDRRTALAEVGRALALDAENREARALLVKLMTHPPGELPPAAERAYLASETADAQRAGRFATFAYFAAVPLGLSPVLWMGIRRPLVIALAFAFIALAGVFATLMWRMKVYRLRVSFGMFVCSTAGLVLAGQGFGPFVMVPTLIAVNTMAYVFHGRLPPWLTIGLASCAVLGPALLAWAGWLPSAYSFVDGRIQILPTTLTFSRTGAMSMLAATSLATLVIGTGYALYLHIGLRRIRRQLLLQAWQLEQVVADPTDERPGA